MADQTSKGSYKRVLDTFIGHWVNCVQDNNHEFMIRVPTVTIVDHGRIVSHPYGLGITIEEAALDYLKAINHKPLAVKFSTPQQRLVRFDYADLD